MIAWLREGHLAKPSVVDGPPNGDARGLATVLASFERGSLFLRNREGAQFRLVWDDRTAERRRALPPGAYDLTGYAIERSDDQGHSWHLSVTGQTIRELEFVAGQETVLELSQSVVFETKAIRGDRRLRVQMRILGDRSSGLSIYRDGRRIPIGYRIAGAGGEILQEGAIEYG